MWRIEKCEVFLDEAGKATIEERTSWFLGEIHLFYTGYLDTVREMVETQVKLEVLHMGFSLGNTDEERIEEAAQLVKKQTGAVEETGKFLNRLGKLVSEYR
jgi:hypothetical protein